MNGGARDLITSYQYGHVISGSQGRDARCQVLVETEKGVGSGLSLYPRRDSPLFSRCERIPSVPTR
jgi:hypothetical protein